MAAAIRGALPYDATDVSIHGNPERQSTLTIVLTCEDFLPDIGGAEVCVDNLRRELRLRGHRPIVFTNTRQLTNDERDIVRVSWQCSIAGIWRNWWTLWRLIDSCDIVHCMYSFRIAALCACIAYLRGKPMLLTQQGKGIVPEANPRPFGSFLAKGCQHISMKLCTHITSTSDEITDLTAAFVARTKITSVSNGFEAGIFRPDTSLPIPKIFKSLPASKKRLLTVRRLVPKNGIHILVQALALVARERQDFHYVAIGEGRSEQYIRSLIVELGIATHITLVGKLQNAALPSFYQHADLVLIPSSAEARSITCIEAMGMAKPIIASKVGGLIDLMTREESYGQLVNIYDGESCTYAPPERMTEVQLRPLADAILSFLRDPEPLRKKGLAAREIALQEYSWNAIVEQYLTLYASILSRSSNPRA